MSKNGQEDEISSFINQQAIETEKQYLVSSLKEILGVFKQINALEITIKGTGGVKEATKAMKDYSDQLIKSEKLEQEISKSRQRAALAIAAEEKATRESIRTKQAEAKATQEATRAQDKLNAAKEKQVEAVRGPDNLGQDAAALNAKGEAVNRLDKLQAQAAISATEYGNSVNRSTGGVRTSILVDKDLEAAKLRLSKAYGKNKVEIEDLNTESKIANRLAKENALAASGLLTPYQLLERQYKAAAANAKDLGAEYGVQSAKARAASAEANALSVQLQTIDKTVGQSQRNVGNYTSALGVLSKAFGFLRKAAYVIPGIGVAGLIGLLVEPIIAGTKALFGFGEQSEKLKKQQENIASSFKNAADSVGEEISKVTVLKTVLESDNATRLQKIEALKQLKEANFDYFGQLDIEDGKVVGLTNSYDAYVSSLIRSITAKANIEQLTTAIKEQQNIVGKINTNSPGKEGPFTAENLTQYKIFEAISKFNLTFAAQKGQAVAVTAEQRQLIADLLNSEIKVKEITDKIKGSIQEAFKPKKETTGAAKKEGSISDLKERVKTEFDIYRIQQEAKIRGYENNIKSDKVYYLDKLSALDNYIKASQELIQKQEQNDIANIKREADRQKQNLEEDKKGKSPEQIKRIDDNIAIIEQNAADQILKIQAKANDDSVKLVEGAVITKENILEDYLKYQKALDEEYAKQEQDLIDKTLDRFKKGLEKREAQERSAGEKRLELEKQLNEKRVQLGLDAENVLYSLGNATFIRALNLIQDQKDAIDLKKEQQLKANDAVVQSEEQKAANIAIINSRAEQEKEKLDKKSREIKLQQAKFERAQQVFEIAIQTIKAVAAIKANAAIIAANPLYGPVAGKALAAIALAQIPFVIAGGALSTAALLAQPLPKFKYGKDANNRYEGFAVIDDGGRIEPTLHSDGTIDMATGSAQSRLTYLKRDDVVFPSIEDMLQKFIFPQLGKTSESERGFNFHFDEVVEAVKGINITTQIVTERGHEYRNVKLSEYNQWVEKYIKN